MIEGSTAERAPVAVEPCLSVVMPAYNEEATILTTLKRVLESPYTQEVVVVNDGSQDATADLVKSIDDPRVRLFNQPFNQGKGAALQRGFREATAPFLIIQDADLEYDPADYAKIMPPLLRGDADVVYGSRFQTSGERRVLYYWHSLGNKFITLFSNMMTNLNLTDVETCYKAFRREILDGIEIHENRFGIEPEITAKLAAAGARIYEVGVSYSGRTYAEGKKIGWKDGVRAMYCIVRYSRLGAVYGPERKRAQREASGFAEADLELMSTLHSMSGAENYLDWIFSRARPHLGRRVLEVGAGHGDLTGLLATDHEVTALELSDRNLALLEERFASRPEVSVLQGDALDLGYDGEFDSVISANVLEHIDAHVEALARMRDAVRPGGTVVAFVPAMEALYSEFDRKIGHQRRYHRKELLRVIQKAGLEPVDVRYMNMPGALAWWLYARLLRRTLTAAGPVRLYDRVAVPIVRRIEERLSPPFGQSLLAVARRPD